MKSIKDIFKITTLFSGVQGLNILLNLARTKLAALILGPSGIGLNSIYNEMRELIHTTTNMGMDISGVREISQAVESGDDERLNNAILLTRSWCLLLALFGGLICAIIAEPLSWITFSDYDHVWDFVLLAPSVVFSTLACCEMSILKGMRRIKALATISVLDIVAAIFITIPIYYVWGLSGIVSAILVLTIAIYVIVSIYTYRHFPVRLCFNSSYLKGGIPMLTIGLSFVLTGIASHGMELAVRTYLNNVASLNEVGLYSAGLTIFSTCGGVIFASLDNDFFPRLSGAFSNEAKRLDILQKQIGVLLMLVVPLVLVIIFALPILVPLLFSNEFKSVIPMAQLASLGLVFRAVYLPTAYMPLSAGDSKSFLVLEIVSNFIVFISVVFGYNMYGLSGAGVALAFSNLADMLITLAFVRWRYNASITKRHAIVLVLSVIVIALVLKLYI